MSVCPTGWRIPPDEAIRYGRFAVDSCVFPLYEVMNGKYKLSYEPKRIIPVKDYMKGQGRFRHLTDKEIEQIQEGVTRDYQKLVKLSEED
jgi:pyruvate/2-oxoacid:ferredoxin oxidoreductase beta subunit